MRFSAKSRTILQWGSVIPEYCGNHREFLYHGATASSGPGPLHYRGFTIILRHTTIGRISLDKWL